MIEGCERSRGRKPDGTVIFAAWVRVSGEDVVDVRCSWARLGAWWQTVEGEGEISCNM